MVESNDVAQFQYFSLFAAAGLWLNRISIVSLAG
jgi:hypothetical protein